MKKVTVSLMVSLVGNTVSITFLFMALLTKYSLIGAIDFTRLITLGMLSYLGGTLAAFIALGVWKRGQLLGKVSIASGIENMVIGLLLVAILLQDVVKAPIVILPFLTGYCLIQQGNIALKKRKEVLNASLEVRT